jgi:hypothetical protein
LQRARIDEKLASPGGIDSAQPSNPILALR